MNKRKLILCVLVLSAVIIGVLLSFNNSNNNSNEINDSNNQIMSEDSKNKTVQSNEPKNINSQHVAVQNSKTINATVKKDEKYKKHVHMYNDIQGNMLPLSAITLMAELPSNINKKLAVLSESNNVYMVQKLNDKILVITDNPLNIRHNIEFTEISIANGHQIKTTLGYNDKMQDSDNDIWEYDSTSQRPIRHTKYNKDGDVDFSEIWNYDNDDPIKYEMKDGAGKVISLRKETLNGASDLRVEHLIYDSEGNTKVNVSITYDGADVKRFTYFNADKPSVGGSIFDEYSEDGNKTRETVYTSDLKVKNSYLAKYKDGNRDELIVLDKNNQEIETLLPNSESKSDE